MNFKQFKSGAYIKQLEYKSFRPEPINHTWTWDDAKVNVLLEDATRSLGELNAFSIIVPDIDLFIHMHILKEAQSSSKIEGTKTEIDEALMEKEDVSPEKRDDWQEVNNYVRAINHGVSRLDEIPLSSRLLREMHKILLDSVRGEHKTPGEYRKSQNWIGGSSLSDAVYVPPIHTELDDYMNDFEKFLHNVEIEVPHLIKAAIAHYQFETIHPFLDGNGRIGRLLITLYLVSNGLLKKPSLYLSDFFEKNRASYYDALSRVRESNDIIHWIKFFLNAIIHTSEKGKATFQGILNLKNKFDHEVFDFGRRAENARKLIIYLYSRPIISVNEAIRVLDVSKRASRELINEFEKRGILHEITGYKRNRMFLFRDYLALF